MVEIAYPIQKLTQQYVQGNESTAETITHLP